MQRIFRRSYATIHDAAAAARTASTPRAVRLRRLQKRPEIAQAETDVAHPDGLTPTEFARYQRALAKGELMGNNGQEPTEGEWLERLNARRMRLRGTRQVVAADGTRETQVVGQKVYLPNILFRLVRNHTPPGKPYNPYEATFRIPQSVTKTDVRNYLAAVYGVQTTYIRTDNYIAPITRTWNASFVRKGTHRTYKRAVVGLVEPFYYPQAPEDMSAEDRAAREEWIGETYQTSVQKDALKLHLLRMTKKNSSNWSWRNGTTANRGVILKRIAEQRALREQFLQTTKQKMQEARSTA
ncbi:mitochondrial ribosomal protein L23 [Auriscalpium vulgare]|uniref:Mitochondrial ribosomal protein L23 n=1 Tax=Auriscalpium vulgare TaxID=40419 RepID=A0ACB8RNZ9_9AGAM|nr:mitochondrial ribosomal protein L23 [Auriscalpium vulgare]